MDQVRYRLPPIMHLGATGASWSSTRLNAQHGRITIRTGSCRGQP
jgi:hypothetical protein